MNTSWKRKPKIERGIICGCDAAQEWLLPWWWARYSLYNSYPVLFCDFGLSKKARAWCQERGQVISIPWDEKWIKSREEVPLALQKIWMKWNKTEKYWGYRPSLFKKPFAMLESPFITTIWLDIDCEVLTSLDDLFSFCTPETPLGLSEWYDKLYSQQFSCPIVHNGGVVVFRHGIDIFSKQAAFILEWNHQFYAEDNVLSFLIFQTDFPIFTLEKEWNWLIADYGPNIFAHIAHWNLISKKALLKHDGMKPFRDNYHGIPSDLPPTSALLRASAFGLETQIN